MYTPNHIPCSDTPDITAPIEEKKGKWKSWARRETQLRTLLGLYVLDGQIAYFSNGAPSVSHVTNSLALPSKESVFNAKTAEQWIVEMRHHREPLGTFREVFISLFDSTSFQAIRFTSHFSVHVALEGLQALVFEGCVAAGAALGIPSRTQTSQALLRLFDYHLEKHPLSFESIELLLRWHTICLNLAIYSGHLCRQLCTHHGVDQHLFPKLSTTPILIDIHRWVYSSDARRALLHAFHIHELVERLPMGRAHATHIPCSVFAAATVYGAFCTASRVHMLLPDSINWKYVWDETLEPPSPQVHAAFESWSFILGLPSRSGKLSRNLRYSLCLLQGIIQKISSQWGVAQEMSAIVLAWTSRLS
ncbi:hypothetical protein N7450_005459 [Penicillium hetheringtonii]|uniref:Transcription factor domain-containing protein n=1 Tax=Penicillium hetheringtonii TaxID=911720 RepID=A0AAD6DIJ1_9EURO|nr:hypothetical protein N7450_005459 [Penicillium hetheringtonii]